MQTAAVKLQTGFRRRTAAKEAQVRRRTATSMGSNGGVSGFEPVSIVDVVLTPEDVDMDQENFDMLKELFALADSDGSGDIDIGELSSMLRTFGDIATPEEVEAMMAAVDDDNSGTIV